MKTPKLITSKLIAPCGMNCALCMAYEREKKPCKGCRGYDKYKPTYCRRCIIVNCPDISRTPKGQPKFCFDCKKLPCQRLKGLDKRYRTKYGMSMLENLENIKKWGIRKFVKSEQKRWKCPKCGELLCVHRDKCLECGKERKKTKFTK